MAEIKCPHCNKVFQVDESGYAAILSQVKDAEFHRELERREAELKDKQKTEEALIREQEESKRKQALAEQEKGRLEAEQKAKDLEAKLLLQTKEAEIHEKEALEKADRKIQELQSQLALQQQQSKNAMELQQQKSKQEIENLQNKLDSEKKDAELQRKKDKEAYDFVLAQKQEELERARDYKTRLSTKMIGEDLEQYCLARFNEIRMGAFPRAYFEKDNDASTGSKGDFIFRDYDEDRNEIVSIMFDMKNEADATETKHKNEDFFKKLDKDRNEKKCEYAVLVSMLEMDNEFYNGIADVSYRFPKMYVVRPQFFIPLITLLRNASMKSVGYQRRLAEIENQSLDVKNFENNLLDFQTKFGKNYQRASEKFKDAIEQIDKTINSLQKIKDNLTSSENNLRLANDKAQELSIKRLTKNAPSVRAMFEEEAKKKD